MAKEYVVIDLETTGLDIMNESIIEIAAVKVKRGLIVDSFSTLVACDTPLRPEIELLTGITTEMLAGQPELDEVLPQLEEFVGEADIAAHNAEFDSTFLHRFWADGRQWLDTITLAQIAWPCFPSYSLANLCAYLDIDNEAAHRALGDAMDADTMFRRMAEFALEMAEGCRYACISFSYPCRIRPDGDGEILALAKEVEVTGAEGRPVCACLEAALVALGAKGERKWRLVNDSVGSLLGGMATADRSLFDDYIGFILGTGVNSCCRLPAAWITKDPQAAAMGGETVVNMESGCFGRLLFGTADRLLDERSEMPGDHPAEKMISGSYFRQLLTLTLELAAREGEIPGEFTKNIGEYRISSANVDAFYLDPHGDNPLAAAISDREAQDFAAGVNDALLERAARVAAAGLCAVIESRSLPQGSRVCICADGSMIRLSPALRPKMEAYLRAFALEKLGVETQFRFADDATLLGCAWAGLIG